MQDSEIVEQPEPDRRAARSTRNNVCLRRARYGRARRLGQRCDAKHAKPMLLASTEQLVALLTRVLGSDVLLDDVICRARAHSQIEASAETPAEGHYRFSGKIRAPAVPQLK